MSVRNLLLAALTFTTLACAGTGEFEQSAPERDAEAAAPGAKTPRSSGTREWEDARPTTSFIARNYNLTIQVDDPAAALDRARTMISEGGADVTNADRGPEYASLNAVVPRGQSQRLFIAIRGLGDVTNESQGINDMRASVHELRRKLRRIDLAQVTLQQTIRASDDPDEVDALVMLLEMSNRERDAARQQLQSHETQGRGDQLYISFNVQPPAAPPPIELGKR